MKEKCASAAYDLIHDGDVVGLGGGQTVAILAQKLAKSDKKITAVTPSQATMELCARLGIPMQPLELTDHIDIAFDGCDELDEHLNALKSNGGIHVREKIAASMADEYILLADETKVKPELVLDYPITIEVIRSARSYVENKLTAMGADVTERTSPAKAGLVISDDGNYLIEARFKKLDTLPPQIAEELAKTLDGIAGIAGHSLFCSLATGAIITRKDQTIDIKRSNEARKNNES